MSKTKTAKPTPDREALDEICNQLQPLAEYAKDKSVMYAARRMLDAKDPPRGLTLGEQVILREGDVPR